METVDRWLKSLRLHKYTPLFMSLTYEEMLAIEEKFLIEKDITKGARNKILVSIKKLNLRQDRLVYMIDDLNQGNISMKEALTVLKEMLITPIPKPCTNSGDRTPSPTISLTDSLPSVSSGISVGSHDTTDSSSNNPSRASSATGHTTPSGYYGSITGSPELLLSNNSSSSKISSPTDSSTLTPPPAAYATIHYVGDPYDLTHLFVETFEKVAQRLIESAAYEDNACHGIMAAIVDECLKHNSFTNEQKVRVACFNQPLLSASGGQYQHNLQHNHHHQHQQKVRMARFNQSATTAREQKAKVARYKQIIIREQKARMFKQPPSLMRQFYQHQSNSSLSISSAASSPSTVAESAGEQQQLRSPQLSSPSYPYKEYSLLGPGLTFELPCLREKAAEEADKPKRNHLSLF